MIAINAFSVILILGSNGVAGAALGAIGLSMFATALPIIILYREVKYLLRTKKALQGSMA